VTAHGVECVAVTLVNVLSFTDFRLRKAGVSLFWNSALEFAER
jgi:hypothetical protein